MTNPTLQKIDLLDQLILTINCQKASSWEQLMILNTNNTVQHEMTFTLSHKRAICGKATCTLALIHSIPTFDRKWTRQAQAMKDYVGLAPEIFENAF